MVDSTENDTKRSESTQEAQSPFVTNAPSPQNELPREAESKELPSDGTTTAQSPWSPVRRAMLEDSQDATVKTQLSASVELSQRTVENLEFVLPDEALTERTLSEKYVDEHIGKHSENLSDLSDDELLLHPKSRNMFTTWYKRIQPLVRNKQVRYLSVVNLVLSLINVILFFGILGIVVYVVYVKVQVYSITSTDHPCVFEWNEWSPCNASCSGEFSSNKPMKTRTVNVSTMVRARGEATSCPDDILDRVDSVPCNTFLCPQDLSSFPFPNETCFFQDPVVGAAAGCYRIRTIPRGVLVTVDADNMTEPCEQSVCAEMDLERTFYGNNLTDS